MTEHLLLAATSNTHGALGVPELSAPVGIALAILLVLLNGFFVAAEFALVKVRPTQIDAHLDSRRGQTARHMIRHLDAYLSATQLGITLASLGLGWIGEPAVASLLGPLLRWVPGVSEGMVHSISIVVGFSIISILHIVLGELVPKSMAIRKPRVTSLWVAVPLYLFYRASFPVIWALNKAANLILKMVGIEPVTEGALAQGEEEIRRLLASTMDSNLTEDKRELLDNIFELSHRVARQVMVPRAEVVFLDNKQSLEENLEVARGSGHTRFPLCDGDLDHILGLIHIKDLFHAREHPSSLEAIKRQTFMAPETLSLERLLRRMRSSHIHMAPVLDEYGSVSGIVTLENVIEEIVGEIQDEFDSERPEFVKLDENVYQVLGSILIEDLEAEIGAEIDPRDEDTVAGVALSEIGRQPAVGDKVSVGPLELEVLEVELNRILSLKVTIHRDEEAIKPSEDEEPLDN